MNQILFYSLETAIFSLSHQCFDNSGTQVSLYFIIYLDINLDKFC